MKKHLEKKNGLQSDYFWCFVDGASGVLLTELGGPQTELKLVGTYT